jgi:hypothetical protein
MDTNATYLSRCALAALAFASALLISGCGGGGGDGSNTGPSALFGSPVLTGMGGAPSSLTWGDFNGDGKTDVVYTLQGGTAFVMLGNEDGTFQPAHAISGLSAIYSVAVGDLNGDGKLDLAVTGCPMPACSPDGPSLFILLGNGDGTLQAPVAYPVISHAQAVSIGDVNGDGHPDVVVGHDHPVVSVLLGNGDGTLKAPTDWSTGGHGLSPVADAIYVSDVTAHGKQDLVVFQSATADASISVLLGHGDGTFDAPRQLGVSMYFSQTAIADFNRDGRPDVAFTGQLNGPPGGPFPLMVALGIGDGTFGPASTPAYPVMYAVPSFATGDLDGDGNPDLVVRASSTSDLSILYGKGDGTFLPAQTFPLSLSGAVDRIIDLNGDGRPDLVLTTATGIAVLLNTH